MTNLARLVAGVKAREMSTIIPKEKAYQMGRETTQRLRSLIPRQNFEVSIQAAIGSKIIAREKIAPYRKDVTAGLYGGGITRKRKGPGKHKKGEKKKKRHGKV